MTDMRRKDGNWPVPRADGSVWTDDMSLAVLMDIRDELKALNRLLNCPNFLGIFGELRGIRHNTTKPRRKRKT